MASSSNRRDYHNVPAVDIDADDGDLIDPDDGTLLRSIFYPLLH